MSNNRIRALVTVFPEKTFAVLPEAIPASDGSMRSENCTPGPLTAMLTRSPVALEPSPAHTLSTFIAWALAEISTEGARPTLPAAGRDRRLLGAHW